MDFKEKLLTQVLYNLIQILQAALGQWTELTPEEMNIRKALRRIDVNPIVKFGFGPFESLNDRIYESSQFVEEVEANNRRIQGKILGLEIPQKMRTESQDVQPSNTSNQETIEDKNRENKEKEKQREEKVTPSAQKQIEGMRTKPTFNSSSEASRIVNQKLKHIENKIKSLRQMVGSLRNLKKELGSVVDESSVGKVSRIFNMRENLKKKERNEHKNRITDKNGFKGMNNNIAFNNRYQIDGIFIINRLSEGKEPSDPKSIDYKKPDVEIFNELTTSLMKNLLPEMLNYLNVRNIFEKTETDCSKNTNPPCPPPQLDETEIKFLRDFERNFSRIFPNRNVTREEVNRMIKVIDFVDRYRGTVDISNSRFGDRMMGSETNSKMVQDVLKDMTKNREVDDSEDTKMRIRGNDRVLCDGGLDLFTRLDITEPSDVKKKGSIN